LSDADLESVAGGTSKLSQLNIVSGVVAAPVGATPAPTTVSGCTAPPLCRPTRSLRRKELILSGRLRARCVRSHDLEFDEEGGDSDHDVEPDGWHRCSYGSRMSNHAGCTAYDAAALAGAQANDPVLYARRGQLSRCEAWISALSRGRRAV